MSGLYIEAGGSRGIGSLRGSPERALRARRRVALALGTVAMAVALMAQPAAASTTVSLHIVEAGSYSCLGPCASATYFNVVGRASSNIFRTMRYTTQGTVLSYDQNTNCLSQVETWQFTVRRPHHRPDHLFLTTTSDTFCFTSNPNVSHESATFVITGGSGRLRGATGQGSFAEDVLTTPQVGGGTMDATLTY